jgi:curli biogenesis system outer membrane secretion channel CsgG
MTTHGERLMRAAAMFLMAAGAGCATSPSMGGGGGHAATGSAAGATSQGANKDLEHCNESLGTLAVVEDQNAHWYRDFSHRYPGLGSTVPVLRMMVQQSNCFVVVERGRAMNNMMQERALERSGEMRQGSNFGGGQMVAADYTMNPSIQLAAKDTKGVGGALSGFGLVGSAVGAVAGGLKKNEASTTLLLVDNRSGVQLAGAQGSADNFDFNLLAGARFGNGMSAGSGGYSNTPEGKIIVAAFADSYNQMVRALRNYKAQTVQGGLGTGGKLGVQGGSTPASQ